LRITTAGIVRRGDAFLIALRKPGTSIGESWEFPGGKNRDCETPQDTLVREYREELGVSVSVEEKVFTTTFRNKDKRYELQAYTVKLLDSHKQLRLREHQEVKWLPISEILQLPLADSDRALALFLSGQESGHETERES
jgi:8-oxo-dGTP diphosphatase